MRFLILMVLAPSILFAFDPETPKSPSPSSSLGYYWSNEADFSGESGSLQFQEFALSSPFYQKKWEERHLRLVFGVRYRFTSIDFSGLDLVGDQDLHGIELPIDFLIGDMAKGKWLGWVRLRPGIYSDFDEIGSNDFSFNAIGSIGYRLNPKLVLALGAFYTRDFGADVLYPSLGVIWNPNDEWFIRATPPIIDVIYSPTENWNIKLGVFPGGGEWNLHEGEQELDLALSAFRAGVGIERRLFSQAWLNIWAGARLFQDLEIQDAESERVLYESDVDESIFSFVGVKWYF